MPKIKGSHTAMKSGMIAAETIVDILKIKEGYHCMKNCLEKLGLPRL